MKIHAAILLAACLMLQGCAAYQKSRQEQREREIKYFLRDYEKKNWMERQKRVRSLLKFKTSGANEFLIKAFIAATYDPHSQVRMEAITSLNLFKSAAIMSRLKEITSTDRDDNVRSFAITSLSAYDDPSCLDFYLAGLNSGDWLVRETSIRAVYTIKDESLKRKAVPQIIKAMNDPNGTVKLAAIKHVSIKDMAIYYSLAGLLSRTDPSDHTLLKAILSALYGYRLDDLTRERIMKLLNHGNREVRNLAGRVLKREKNISGGPGSR